MKRKLTLIVVLGLATLLIAGGVTAGSPLGTGFTYQGFLKYGGNPADGAYDFEFRLYDGEVSEIQVGSSVILDDVAVINGLFVVQLDFGTDAFNGDARWLEIGVSTDRTTITPTLLAPRQALTAVPYALYAGTTTTSTYANNAGNADTVDGLHASDVLGSSWSLTGNAGTTAGTNFVGTTDNQALEIKVNNTCVLRLEPNTSSPNLIGGYSSNWVAPGVFGAVIGGGGQSGNLNRVVDHLGVVGGGQNNQAGSDNGSENDNTFATVAGGANNTASGTLSAIGGGSTNTATGYGSTVAGGRNNAASSSYAFVGGGLSNEANGPSYGPNVVVGGQYNTAAGDYSFIGGGANNEVTGGIYSVIAAGGNNRIPATGWGNFIGGGYGNVISGTMGYATITGGRGNSVGNSYATVAGGRNNTASGAYSSVAGGQDNTANGDWAVAAGRANTVSGSYATVPGGVFASATHFGEMAHASGGFSVTGDAQASTYVLRREYAMAAGAWHDLFLDGNAASQRLTIAPGRTVTFSIVISGRTESGESAGYRTEGVIENVGGITTLVGTPTVTVLGEDDPAWNVQVIASDALDALLPQVQGNGETIRWVATVNTAEVSW